MTKDYSGQTVGFMSKSIVCPLFQGNVLKYNAARHEAASAHKRRADFVF